MLDLTPIIGRVWIHENRVSSDGEVFDALLSGLPEDALELYGRLVKVDGKYKLNGIFNYDPFQPERIVTQDGFDQVQLYYSLNVVHEYLLGLGIDTRKIIASQHKGKFHPIAAHANAVDDLNAWYSPQSDDLTFGTNGNMETGEDKWHLASDSDVTIHEAGHLILDHINKKLASWWTDSRNFQPREGDDNGWGQSEGRAIHEGFGDLLAALYYDDPELSEDFPPNLGRPESKTDGLRIADNDLTLDDVGTEEHDRGRVYSGFFWSIKERLQDPEGPFKLTSRQASDLTLKLLFNHASNYDTSRPKPADFVKAVIKGAEGLAEAGKLGVDLEALKAALTTEAERRKLIVQEPEPQPAPALMSYEELSARYGRHIRFATEQKTVFYGGVQEIQQQMYKLSTGDYVDVVGSGIFVQKDALGKTVSISTKDVRSIKSGGIDETVRIDGGAALTIALGHAQKQLLDARNRLINFTGPVEELKDLQMEYRIAEAAVHYLTDKSPGVGLVIIPGSDHLHYEIKVGLGIYYIDAQTGGASFKRDVLVN